MHRHNVSQLEKLLFFKLLCCQYLKTDVVTYITTYSRIKCQIYTYWRIEEGGQGCGAKGALPPPKKKLVKV